MSRFAKLTVVPVLTVLAASTFTSAHAVPVTIGFEAPAVLDPVFGQPYFNGTMSQTEAGFTYSPSTSDANTNSLYIASNGNPGQDIEADGNVSLGILKVVSSTLGQTFTFLGIDAATFNQTAGVPGTITVTGQLSGQTVGTESYTVNAVNLPGPLDPSGPYANWTTEVAAGLAGKTIDTLLVSLPANSGDQAYAAIDNLSLETGVPEPASLALFGAGLLGLAMHRRRMG